jgi:hypothetical protein
MIVEYRFTEAEKELIKELESMNNTFNYSSDYDAFRRKYKEELSGFIEEGLLYHSNRNNEGAYIRYSVSEKGEIIFKLLKTK